MSQHPTPPQAAAAEPSPVEEAPWRDDPNYPHRIENHVKVYLHLVEESSTQPVIAAEDSAPPPAPGSTAAAAPAECSTER